MRRTGWAIRLAACGAAVLIAAATAYFLGMQLHRPTMRDAVFVRKIEKWARKGGEI